MSDIQRASKALSKSSSPATGVFSVRGTPSSGQPAHAPMQPAANAFSGFGSEPKRASWDELSRERDPDGETKNYSVPPELIALARANRKGRGEVGTLTPLAPKPAQDVVVVIPAASPLALDLQPSSSPEADSALQAPSVPIPLEGSSHDPESARTAIQGRGNLELALAASSSPAMSSPAMSSPLADMMRGELAAAAAADAVASELDSSESQSIRPSSRRSSRRSPRSLRIELPVEAAAAARAVDLESSPRSHTYLAYATGAVLVCGYVALCYYANALLAGLP
jgi:hypothetical protein